MVAANKVDWLKIERSRLGKIDRSVYGYAEGHDNLLVFDRFDDRSDEYCPQGGTCVFDPEHNVVLEVISGAAYRYKDVPVGTRVYYGGGVGKPE